MIEDYQAKRRRARIVARALLGVGIVLAALAAITAYALAAQGRPVVSVTEVVVAARDIPARTVLSAADLRMARMDPALLPTGAVTDPASVVGRTTADPMSAREVLVPARLATTASGVGVFPSGQQPTGSAPDYRAMSLNVADANAVGGAVQPGDTVDVVFALTYEPSIITGAGTPAQDHAARIIAERVPILARVGPIYTIRVEAQQAERIAALTAGGAVIHFLLRAGDDARVPRASGAVFTSEAGGIIRAIPVSPRPSPRP